MAAVAAEPGAAAASTTAGDGVEYEPEPGEHVVDLEAHSVPEMELCHQPDDVDAVQECSQVQMEIRRPDLQAAGKALAAHADGERTETGGSWGRLGTAEQPVLIDYRCTDVSDYEESFSPKVEAANEVSALESSPCLLLPSSIPDSQPSVVFLHSLPAQVPSEPETGLSLAVEYDSNPVSSHPPDLECELIGFTQPDPEPEPANDAPGSELKTPEDAFHDIPHPSDHMDSLSTAEETSLGESVGQSCISDFSTVSSKDSPELPAVVDQSLISSAESDEVRSHPLHQQSFKTDLSEPERESETKDPVLCSTEPGTVERLVLGSEVRVTLDHIIDDALVVSFRLGEKIFSGVLMDLSKRFGPYGIPITVFPKREYKDKPESMQLKTEAFQSETEKGVTQGPSDAPIKDPADVPDAPLKDPAETPAAPQPCPNPQPNPWTSKPPPLFQEGAPYPPPLFIRDTYNQSLPQPLPRKIKRPKRRLYREEPTSIMNAIKLRPRQVLCDKCKGAVVQGDKRETRRGPISDCRSDDAKRRRNDSATAAAGKRPRSDPRSDEKGRGTDGPKRQGSAVRVASATASSLGHSQVKGAAAGNKMVKGVSTTTTSSANSRVQLNAKKVLQSKNVDHSKAREVLKMAKAQRRQRETVTGSGGNTKAITRAAALQEAHQKVHFTRRLQQISGGGPGSNPLPPRMRIKPQRYRNEENDSSSCKPPCLEKVPGGGRLPLPKPAVPRCTSTRSSSSSCSASQAATAVEPQRPDKAFESLLSQAQPEPLPAPEYREPQAEPEEQEGREEKRETRGSKAGNLVVYMTLNPSQPDSSSTSMCSVDSADDLKSSNSECSSTETFDFPPPGDLRSAPAPGTSSAFASASPSAPKDDKKRSKSLKAAVFSKNVTKCVALDGRTICVGDIVWAKILGFPWWPARILAITVSRKDNGLLVRQEARVSWFGSPTTSFLAITQLAPFLENFQSRFDKKRKGLYRKAITEAAKAAKQLTPEVRALLTQFET
ncbi:PWWP domain-containing 2A-like protein [Labeo rohita]|uniref:PWWP domain-containing 2A-like protein n=2 Tax=Labeo rohita TaxID=84645 RepID=A0A498LGB1_LABRO|nr:PWWP domain-containing protein 2A [Labeo rohita]KAI2651250.1 PWWP domain-containing protein 2A [Labeo rohita]RXN07339.1 PWWP domain-containing 2A-like protein [Labeo rohita]RXN36340.1 PWWP domain-containing 2A-like protein [Labeo rohita]